MAGDDAPIGSALLVQLQKPGGAWIDVGLLKSSGSRNWFDILPGYWELAGRPVLGQVFEEHGRTWVPNAHVALPHWFSHLLPEGRLRDAVSLAADVNKAREFELLRRLGPSDLQGAVRAIPTIADGLDYSAPPAVLDNDGVDENPILKFSLAGAQLKYSVFADGRGLTVPASGSVGNVIAKLPYGRAGYEGVPEAEFGALELARRSGIDAAEASLVKISDIQGLGKWVQWVGDYPVLAVERFDRAGPDRVHMEELAQVLGISATRETIKYTYTNFETVANYVAALTDVESVASVIDRLVLNVLVGNGDAHLKNWAFLYPDGRNPVLSPAYDIVPTVLYVAGDNLGLNLGGSKRFEDIDYTSFDELGRRTGFGVARARKQVSSGVDRVLSNWPILGDYLSKQNFSRLSSRLASLPLAKPVGRS